MSLKTMPKDLKNEIFRERSLVDADHKKLADWCRTRAAALQHETFAEIGKKILTDFSRGKIHAVKQAQNNHDDDVPSPPPPPHLAHDVPVRAQSLIAAVKQRPPTKSRSTDRKSNDRNRRRDPPSPGGSLVVGWGNKCFRCGTDIVTRTAHRLRK